SAGRVPALLVPGEGQTQVVVIDRNPREPGDGVRPPEVGLGQFGQRQIGGRVAIPRRLPLAGGLELLQPKLPNRLQHAEARLAVRSVGLGYQAFFNEGGDAVENGRRQGGEAARRQGRGVFFLAALPPCRLAANGVGGLQRATTGEDGEAAEEDL